ncbi:MAG: hypothetical protein FDZ70_08680 [Actinobacteria bacterium]|nr:MAG: hypothetical protein FDZ70_08680 [Actinomycetota bacterium]
MQRRRFYRRNPYAVEEFPDYTTVLAIRFWEGAVRVLGLILLVVGVMLFTLGVAGDGRADFLRAAAIVFGAVGAILGLPRG